MINGMSKIGTNDLKNVKINFKNSTLAAPVEAGIMF